MSKFNVGDRVYHKEKGKGYVIDNNIDGALPIHLVEYDKEFLGGHDGTVGVKGRNGHCWWERCKDIELIEEDNAPTNKIPKLNIGDRVIYVDKLGVIDFGKIGTIVDIIENEYPYLVEFDDYINGHDGNNHTEVKTKDGHGWYVDDSKVVLIEKAGMTVPKIGDKVRVIKNYISEGDAYKDVGKEFYIQDINTFFNSPYVLQDSEWRRKAEELELVKRAPKFKKGEKVKVISKKGKKTRQAWLEIGDIVTITAAMGDTDIYYLLDDHTFKWANEEDLIRVHGDKAEKHKEICKTLNQIYKDKNHDYGDSFGETFESLGIISAVTRITDKVNRLQSLATKEQKVKDETVLDTLYDLANYCIMTIIELKTEESVNRNAQGGINNER